MGFGCYNYTKLQNASFTNARRVAPYEVIPLQDGAVTAAVRDPHRECGRHSRGEKLVAAVGSATVLLGQTTAALTPNLAAYVVSGVFQPLFVVEMNYSGVGQQLGL